MNRSDIYLAIAVILAAIFCGGLCEFALKIGIPDCPEISATVTPAQHDVDSTPNLPLIVTQVKRTVRPIKDTITAPRSKDSLPPAQIDSTPIIGGLVLDLAPITTYNTWKTYPDGDSVHISASSRILPLTPPSDWSWTVDRFTRPDTTAITLTTAKQRHFGFGVTIGAGYNTDNLQQKSWIPKVSVTAGITFLP